MRKGKRSDRKRRAWQRVVRSQVEYIEDRFRRDSELGRRLRESLNVLSGGRVSMITGEGDRKVGMRGYYAALGLFHARRFWREVDEWCKALGYYRDMRKEKKGE